MLPDSDKKRSGLNSDLNVRLMVLKYFMKNI